MHAEATAGNRHVHDVGDLELHALVVTASNRQAFVSYLELASNFATFEYMALIGNDKHALETKCQQYAAYTCPYGIVFACT